MVKVNDENPCAIARKIIELGWKFDEDKGVCGLWEKQFNGLKNPTYCSLGEEALLMEYSILRRKFEQLQDEYYYMMDLMI